MTHDFSEITTHRSPSAAEALGLSQEKCLDLQHQLEKDFNNDDSSEYFDIIETLTRRIRANHFSTRELLWYIYIGYSQSYHVSKIIEDHLRPYKIFTPIGVGSTVFLILTIINALVH